MSESKRVTVEFPIVGLLGLIFITLKLTGYINWSWLWVLAPFWIPLALAFLLILAAFIIDTFINK